MKKNSINPLLLVAAFIFIVVSLSSCRRAGDLQSIVDDTNSRCPISLGLMGNITKVSLEGNTVVYDAVVDDHLVNLPKLRQNTEAMKKGIMFSFLKDKKTLNALLAEKVDLRYIYHSKSSNEPLNLLISHEDLEKMSNTFSGDEKKLAVMMLENQLELTRLQLPMQVDELTKLIDFRAEGNNAVYLYELDAKSVSLDYLRAQIPSMKANAKNLFLMGDPSLQSLLNILCKAGYGLVYRYNLVGTDNQEEFSFSSGEIQQIAQSSPDM